MFHTVAYIAATTATADIDGAAVTDSVETIQNGHIVPQTDKQILYTYAGCVTLLRARLNSPTLRQLSPPFVRPIDNAASPTSRSPVADYRANPLTIRAFEELQFQATNSAAGPTDCYGIIGLARGGITPAPQGQIITMRGTGTSTLVAKNWTQVAITWADTLPAGQYAIVGLSGFSATAVAARLICQDQVERPGAIIGATDVIIPNPMFLKGGLGIWGYMSANRMPNVEFLATAADTAESVYMDFVRVA